MEGSWIYQTKDVDNKDARQEEKRNIRGRLMQTVGVREKDARVRMRWKQMIYYADPSKGSGQKKKCYLMTSGQSLLNGTH